MTAPPIDVWVRPEEFFRVYMAFQTQIRFVPDEVAPRAFMLGPLRFRESQPSPKP